MKDCIFCNIVRGEAKSWKVYENEQVYAFLDIHPVSQYHTLVVPKKHFVAIFDISQEELLEVMAVIKYLTSLYATKLGIQHVQLINNSGREAQQDVFHFHFHIVPRSFGDGQDVKWNTHPEWVGQFDHLLQRLKG
jgi:histidine triad (HIT) family protein